ncbi:MAG TPA: permease [Clostridiales bacterium]|nr:permease [Clostridiales bacterium]
MSKTLKFIKNNKLLVLVVFAYLFLGVFMPDKALGSLKNSLYYVKEMIMIMPVILLLTALINAWVPTKTIEKNLGKDSGLKGNIFSFLLGSFSAGPIYAAFPISKTLFSKGASVSNIVILLSTWAVVKVPMLLNEAKFLGPKFMAFRWVLTSVSIFLMAYITSKFVKKEDIPSNDISVDSEKNLLHISDDYCIACNLCVKIAPSHFEMNNKKAKVINQIIDKDNEDVVNQAIEKCPSKAISFK